MKKILFFAALIFGFAANAQVTFNPGIRAGVNVAYLSDLNNNDSYYYYDNNGNYVTYNPDFKSIVDFYVGFQANIRFSKMYALQPEVNYSRQGTQIRNTGNTSDGTLRTGYVGIQVMNKFYMNNFNLQIGPMFDFLVSQNYPKQNNNNDYYYSDTVMPVDMGISLGAGYDFTKNLGAEVRFKKGIIPVDFFGGSHSNVVWQFGMYYTFSK